MENVSAKANFTTGLKDGIPICLGYVSVAFAFGIFTVNSGLTIWQTICISLANCTSAGQLAGVPVIVGCLSFAEMALTQLVINLRYSLMSISLSQKLADDVTFLDRMLIAFVNTDEVFAVASGQKGMVSRYYFFGLILTPYLGWALGTAFGAVAGNVLPDIVTNALGIAIYGMFIAIILPVAKKDKAVTIVVLIACALSVAFRFIPVLKQVSAGFVIIICAVIAGTAGALLFPVKNAEDGEDD